MRIYTVHEPPAKRRESQRGPESFLFVRDGFYFWAFVLAPIWLAYRRLWLTLLGYVVLMVALAFGLRWAGIGGGGAFLVHLAVAALIGLEAGTLWRWTLRRRGWRELGAVTARDHEAAEHRFFDAWHQSERTPAMSSQYAHMGGAVPAQSAARPPSRGSDIVGLFPEPGAPR
jgi:hypothetical protein